MGATRTGRPGRRPAGTGGARRPVRRRRLALGTPAVPVLAVLVLSVLVLAVVLVPLGAGLDQQLVDLRSAGLPPSPAHPSGPTRSGGTCCSAPSTACASRCWSAWRRRWSACSSAGWSGSPPAPRAGSPTAC
ncbi:hypothetical protein ACFQ0B_59945 [Nonomuraea thailandensis]